MRLENVLSVARSISQCGELKLVNLWDLCKETAGLPGVVVEVGVYKGGSAFVLANATYKPVYLCDTFAGTPEAPLHEGDEHRAGDWRSSVAAVRELFPEDDERITLCVGEYIETFPKLGLPVAFAHIDVDLYHWTRLVLADIWGRLVEGGIVVCDDYGAQTCEGAKAAVDEFLAEVSDCAASPGVETQIVLRKVPPAPVRRPKTQKDEPAALAAEPLPEVAIEDETERLHAD